MSPRISYYHVEGDRHGAALAAAAYRRNMWTDQPARVEVWLEKDALSGIFEDILGPYGVTLNVGRGFDGWSSIYAASQRLGDDDTVLYFGDFDPSGEDMVRSLRARLRDLGSRPELVKSALLFDDIERYRLPPDFTKATDTAATRRHEENERRLLIGALAGIGKE